MAGEAPPASSDGRSSQDSAASGVGLPAPYEDPVVALGRDLRALAATLRLRIQELWRRNRQGDLSVPGFWPPDLAPLFWPLLLALLLTALVALPIATARRLPAAPAPAAERPEKLLTTPLPQARSTAEPEILPLPRAGAAAAPAAPGSAPTTEAELPEPVEQPQLEQPQQPTPLKLDPILQLLSQEDPRHLIVAAHPQPAAGVLQLELSEAYAVLPDQQRRMEADHWLERSRDLGYDRLDLVDASGRLLGRQARVGSGMILLDSGIPS
jgi:hypothetical protein